MGLTAFATKAIDVVLDVIRVALAALLQAKASLFSLSSLIYLMAFDCFHPSTSTKMSSAAIPRTMKITS
jgi:hypothetical protein